MENNKSTILITGALGYIGSHIIVNLLQNDNYDIIGIDNLSNSDITTLDKIYEIAQKRIIFYPFDITDKLNMEAVFKNHKIDKVIHLAGLKSVPQSIKTPLDYYNINVGGTIILLNLMQKYNVKTIVFSSTATIYGQSYKKHTEQDSLIVIGPDTFNSPYSSSKLMIEQILRHIHDITDNFNVIILRPYNPIGNHSSGILLDSQSNNIIPALCRSIIQELPLTIYGNITPDNTAIRDFIHVLDLADAFICSLNVTGFHIYNVGTDKEISIKQLIKELETHWGKPVQYNMGPHREGDDPIILCDSTKIQQELGWSCKYNITDMCRDIVTALNYHINKK